MESCHSVLPPIVNKVPHPPPPYRRLPPKVYSTLGHLIEIIEQLSSREDLSSVLRDLVADGDDLSSTNSRGSYVDLDPGTIIKVAQILRKLNSNCATMATETSGTKTASSASLDVVSGETPGLRSGERAQRVLDVKNMTLSKQDSLYLVKKIKDFEQKCKPLQEKNKKFLEKNMELTAQNRNLKEQIRNIAEENKKLKDSLDQSRRKCSGLSRQLNQEKLEKGSLEIQAQELGKVRTQVAEQEKAITNLKQASAEKDRRMEVLQHRKKRRLRVSAEHLSRLSSPCSNADDERSLDSDISFNSISNSTLSDEELQEELPQDDAERVEKNYKKLMKEHLALQKSMAKLQGILGWSTDPQRYTKKRIDFETDLYVAQCKIENLEECLHNYKDWDQSWVLEKDELVTDIHKLTATNRTLEQKLNELQAELEETTQQYEEAKEQVENLEFLVLETQECDNKVEIPSVSVFTSTHDLVNTENNEKIQEQAKALEELHCSEAALRLQLDMGENMQQEYRATIRDLEEKLQHLLQGQGSEVTTVITQLKQAEQHVSDVESTMNELQSKVITLQEEKSELSQRLKQYRGKLDAQEHSLALSREEREELLQVKRKASDNLLNNRLKLAEVGHDSIRERSLERERSQERMISPLTSPRSPRLTSVHGGDSFSSYAKDRLGEGQYTLSRRNSETQETFEKQVSTIENTEPVTFEASPRHNRTNSVPVLGSHFTRQFGTTSEVDDLQRQISDLQDENDVLRYELAQKGHGDSDASGSDSEDSRLVELRETIEHLKGQVQSAELSERQHRDRIKLAEKHITELELSESVLRDRVEEGNADCDKLRKQIVRLQRKIRELKEVNGEKEIFEQTLTDKLKYLEDTESKLSQKIAELEDTNTVLKQRLELKEEFDDNAETVADLKEKIHEIETVNNDLGSKVIDLEEANEILRDNWKKVADEEADRRECLEEKIKVLECANKDLKSKLKEHESDLDLSACQSIASELNEDAIEQLNERIKELENELESLKEGKDEKIETLQENLGKMKENEVKLTETLAEMESSEKTLKNQIAVLEKSEDSQEAASTMLNYQDKITMLKSSQEDLIERLDSMENHEDDLKEKIMHMEKTHEKQLEMLEREIAEYQQQEDDLCARIKEFEENETRLLSKIENFKENEMNLKNKIEEIENRETSLTIGFSQRVEELERTEKEIADKFYQKIQLLEGKEAKLIEKVGQLEQDNGQLVEKVSLLEKHEKELSEKDKDTLETAKMQENSELTMGSINGNCGSVEIQNKVESFAKLEAESSKSISFEAESSEDMESVKLKALNKSLQEEVENLTLKVQESEKEQKALADKFRKQEKKRKKSQRTDNLDDYDTLAREAVTFKIEVEQLRTENNDLHERVMELDESERSLLEENESLKSELEKVKGMEKTEEKTESNQVELEEKIKSLEETKLNLTDEIEKLQLRGNPDGALIVPVKQSSVDSAYESSREIVKEFSDKLVGTDDFLEGVMCGQEQGKPVSSMFVRIQALETENQELTAKLSALTATDAQVKQLSEKVKALEENEDSLMERVMELEDEEDRWKRELNKAKKSLASVSDIEDELSTLQDSEKELKDSTDKLELENLTLKKTIECSGIEKGDIAVQLAKVQKSYEDEKKKVDSLLKGEEKLMKSVSSQKKSIQEMEDELASTQEKLEELQTEYENKLSDKDENEKLIKEELNKVLREKETLKKKYQEYETSNSELEDEIEACKISESRMFHKHQQLITQNQELELKLDKLMKLLPYSEQTNQDETDGAKNGDKSGNIAMSENPEVISENPLTASIFNETELDLLRSKTPDTDLLGSVPLEMLRKMQEFDQRETNYQTKVQETDQRNMKLSRKVKVMQGKEKDLKQEIKELQLELMKYREPSSSLRASTSSLDRSGSDEGLDSDSQSYEGHEDIFKGDEVSTTQYENMSQKQLILTAKLLEEKQNQDIRRITELEECVDQSRELLKQLVSIVTSEPLESYIQNAEAFKETHQSGQSSCFVEVLDSVTGLRRKLEALQDSEEKLRITLAENEITKERLSQESVLKIQELETQIQDLANVSHSLPQTAELSKASGPEEQSDIFSLTSLRSSPEEKDRFTSPVRELNLDISKTINIDVPPSPKTSGLVYLAQSETIRVDVPPQNADTDSLVDQSDISSEYSYRESPRMMDKAEDVLRQRIRELEKLEKHLKKQVLDLETDREDLHEIARKDKNIIHEQNVLIRELQLSQRNLQAQIKVFETSENTLYARLDEMENELENKSDRIRHLEILEGRLKDLVKQYKLDERILQTKSQTLESSIKAMSAKEETLKQKVENLESEKTAFSERSEYLQLRLKEIENAEIDLAQRSKNQQNIMQSLQNTVIELETFGANAQSRVVELEQINFELQQRLHHAMTENSPLSRQLANTQQQCDVMESELSALKESEIKLRQENEALIKTEGESQQQVKVYRLKEVELDGKVRDLEETDSVMKDKLSKLQRSENTLKYRVQELENSGIQAPSDLSSSLKEGVKLPRTLEDCQRRIIMLQANNAELQSRLHDEQGTSTLGPMQGPTMSLPKAEYQHLQKKAQILEQTERQMEESDRLNTHLQETVEKLRDGKDVCGHEVETEVLRRRLDQANESIKILKNQDMGQWVIKGQNVLKLPSDETATSSRLSPSGKEVILDLANNLPGEVGGVSPTQEIVQEKMAKTTTGTAQSQPSGQMLSRDQMIQDLMQSLEAPGVKDGEEEDRHWREIESHMEATGRGSEKWINIGKATSMYAANGSNKNRSHNKEEELELGVTLQSETESQANSQNDMFSGRYSAPIHTQQQRLYPEQYAHVQRNSAGVHAPPLPQNAPPGVGNLRVTDSFGESLYVPSSAQESLDEYSDQIKEVIVPRRNQPAMSSVTRTSAPSVTESVPDSGRGTASISMATSSMTLRERIAHIERQLSARESDSAREFNSEIDLTSWKAKVHESGRKLEMVERENKAFKDEINKLEKELEEKTRLYLQMESFLKSVESLLKNKNISDGEIVSRIQSEVERVRSGITEAGNRQVDMSLDPAALNTELARKDRELAAKRNEVDSLMKELRQWQQECRTIEDMRSNALDSLRGLEVEVSELQLADKQLKELKDEYNTLKGQGMEDEHSTPRSTATLRARVVQLTGLCSEKDVLIKKLVQELKKLKSGSKPSQLLEEICRIDTTSDYNHNRLSRSSSQSSVDSVEHMSYVSDTELLRESSPHQLPRPRSADAHHHRQIGYRNSHHGNSNLPPRIYASRTNSSHQPRGSVQNNMRTSSMPHLPNKRNENLYNGYSGLQGNQTSSFVAIADYDPAMFSMSGHPRLEIPLKEGDLVKVIGNMDDNGYYEGEVNGQVGLVPASYLQPALPHRLRGNRGFVPQHLNASPERIAQMYSHLHNSHQPDTHGLPQHQRTSSLPNGGSGDYSGNMPYRQTVATGPPQAPSNFHVEKIVGNNSLMLAWQPVTVDGNGCNNGLKVSGYRIFKNNKVLVHPRGPLAAKAIIENVDIHTHHRLGVQTVTADGQVSELSEIMYEGVEEVTSDENSDTESEMDMTSMLDMDVYKEGPKRMFMGIYDYDPTKNSPQDHPNCELAFNAGDTITVFGRQRSDGFYHGEINNVRGLVPAFFIEEIPQAPPRTKKMASRSKQQQQSKDSKTDSDKQSR